MKNKQQTTNLIETRKVLIPLKSYNEFVEDTLSYISKYCKQLLGIENIEFEVIERESKESDCVIGISKLEVLDIEINEIENEIEEEDIEGIEGISLGMSYILSQILIELEDLLKQLLGNIYYGKTKMGEINKFHLYIFHENGCVYEEIKEKLKNKRMLIGDLYQSYLFQSWSLEEQLEELVYCVHETNNPLWNF